MRETTIQEHARFFEDQVKIMEDEYRSYYNAPLSQLFQSEEAYLGTIVCVNEKNGQIIVKFKKNFCPRLKFPMNFVVLRSKVWQELGSDINNWSCSCREFFETKEFHTVYSEIKPLYFLKREDKNYDYVGCGSVNIELFNSICKALNSGMTIWIVMYKPFPPTQYMLNLRNYSEWNTNDDSLLLKPTVQYDNWKPEELSTNDNIAQVVKSRLDEKGTCLLQGPPGTGKSYTIAEIVASYLNEGKTVCVSTMSNKGLTELIAQPPLAEFLSDGKIKKTMLTSEESKSIPGIRLAGKELLAASGELLCTTYYILSGKYSRVDFAPKTPIFDLMVIEEASQAFLTTIAAFRKLGRTCLIVGDPMQLPPIILQENKSDYQTWDLPSLANGLTTVALGDSKIDSFRITTTYRLTPVAAELTGVFYSNNLKSVQKDPILFENMNTPCFFPKTGGTLVYTTCSASDAICSENALSIMHCIVDDILSKYPQRSIAIISPFRDSVKRIQKEFNIEREECDIIVDTVDRIQGMTVDYAIFYLPQRNISFALTQNRFNVATSRSRSTTLIISDLPLVGFRTISKKISQYLSQCTHIDNDIKSLSTALVQNVTQEKTSYTQTSGVKVVGKIDLSQFERKKVEIQPTKKNYYIIDTNVFINYPEILSKINAQYPVILSAKVIDELDKMKIRSEEEKKNAETALRLLNRENSRKIIFETADATLLPVDYDKRSPDNLILSVALKYKNENPIMLTSDNGLQLKCKALGITTITLKAFLKQSKH